MTFPLVQLGTSDLHVTPICLGTMTFGEQVNEADSHAILDRSLARGVNFIDKDKTASRPECYPESKVFPRPHRFRKTTDGVKEITSYDVCR